MSVEWNVGSCGFHSETVILVWPGVKAPSIKSEECGNYEALGINWSVTVLLTL